MQTAMRKLVCALTGVMLLTSMAFGLDATDAVRLKKAGVSDQTPRGPGQGAVDRNRRVHRGRDPGHESGRDRRESPADHPRRGTPS